MEEQTEYADNRVSRFMAWGSKTFLPTWCQSEDHWTAQLTNYLFTDCPCCLLFRGIVVGFIFGIAIGAVLTYMIS